ncbi:sugar porter family MFS transporter [Colletotrichum graminicola]|uniref:Sugar porter family MFS transporter n=2 Tax=Colletotrichum graminicola TaxID=31870 RepID=E3QKP5_COLGM|nr:sugar porter family MFS transporter [Colletotrichum graminicola M1.001]EFQ31433.1 sugar porter family MFS transporter [Colletotrichum graminicola M1.001]WDK19720.1 sugar porter family MFS transporter [Colletotrichum graminicola]CBA11552.1 alpha glucoside transporter [Colletotrichum graminicola]CBA11553.1 alpha glucoside transporter [Colletotrichum graminicola]
MYDTKTPVSTRGDKETGIHHHHHHADDTTVEGAAAVAVVEGRRRRPEDLAADAARAEHQMTLLEAVRTYPKAIGWSVLLSSTLVMEGYDLALLGNLYSSAVFNDKYGAWSEAQGRRVVSAAWQSGLSNGARAGEVLGLVLAGWAADRYGYRLTTMGFLVLMIAFIFVLFFVPNVQILVLGEVLCGIPWGAFQSVTPAYASEVAPVVLRPYLTTFINMCWVIGQFFSAAVNKGSYHHKDEWAYRIPFGVQWVWPVPILIGLFFAPESPWWYVRHNDKAAAKRALLRLTSRNQPKFNPDETIAMIEHTDEMERRAREGVTYRDCFRGVNLRRTEIVVGVWIVQTLGGQNLMGYFAYFLTQAGMDPGNSFSLSMGQYALGMAGTAGSWFLMHRVGRRTIHFSGLCAQCALLLVVGGLSFSGANASVWAIGAVLVLFTFVYDFTVGPVTYSLVSELSSTRLKNKTIVLARAAYNASNIFVNVMTNYQLSSTAWDWGARTALFWAGTCLLSSVWAYFRVPEPKGRTYAELDLLFEHGVSARKFAGTKVDPYSPELGGEEKLTEEH